MSTQGPAGLYSQGFGTHFENVEIPWISNRAPTSSDVNYPVGKHWINSLANTVYELTSFTSAGGTITANWTYLAQAAGALNTLTTSDSSVVTPSTGNINISQGDGILTTGSGATVTITLDVPIDVEDGGTGAQTLTNHGVLLGQGASAIAALAVAATGTVLAGSTGANPAFTASPSVTGSVTAGTGLTATTGGLTVTAGGAAITGTTTINTTGNANTTIGNAAGSNAITINTGSGNFSLTGNANTIGIGNDAAGNTINIGSTTTSAATLIQAGTGLINHNGVTNCSGNVILAAAGNKFVVKTGANASAGTTAAMTTGAIAVATTAITASSVVLTSINTLGTVADPKATYAASINPGVSFAIISADATDTSTVNWLILN
jgi:hypothetical protein